VKRVFHPTRDLPYIDTENMENNQLTLETKADEKIKTLLNTPPNKENK